MSHVQIKKTTSHKLPKYSPGGDNGVKLLSLIALFHFTFCLNLASGHYPTLWQVSSGFIGLSVFDRISLKIWSVGILLISTSAVYERRMSTQTSSNHGMA